MRRVPQEGVFVFSNEKPLTDHSVRGFLSAPLGIRTLDTLIKSQVLYQLS